MAVIVQPSDLLFYVDDALLTQYQAAGWVVASGGQIATWNGADTYGGAQGYPPAPPLLGSSTAPSPETDSN